jgi:hypothetical protein
MPASHVRLEAKGGLRDLFCPACAAPVFTDEAGASDELCDHVCFFIDWAGEITLASPDNYTGDVERRQQAIVDLVEETDDWDEFIAKAAKALPASAVILDIDAPTEGDEEDATRVVVAIDFAAAEDLDDE